MQRYLVLRSLSSLRSVCLTSSKPGAGRGGQERAWMWRKPAGERDSGWEENVYYSSP